MTDGARTRSPLDDLPFDPNRATRGRLLIDGHWVDGTGERVVCNPADTTEVVGTVPDAGVADVEAAVASARHAQPTWAGRPVTRRVAEIRGAADSVRRRRAELATLLVRETGKIRAEAEDELERTLTFIERACASAESFATATSLPGGDGVATGRQPVGVVGVIAPWNAPVILSLRRAIPALLMGNAVVLRPSSSAPFTVAAITATLARALPPGAVNLVIGGGPTSGQALAGHPDVRAISFTGSVESGRAVLGVASRNLTRAAMELGGNDPAIVLADAAVTDAMVAQIASGVYRTSGQVCFAIKRIYVEESSYRAFTHLFMEHVDRLVIGNGLDPRATMGPLHDRHQFDFVAALVAEARDGGLKIRELGRPLDPPSWGRGYFLRPSVVLDPPVDARVVTCEQFGPVVPLIPVKGVEEAIELANATEFGLRASVWCSDHARGRRVASALHASVVGINRLPIPPIHTNFVGVKHSGVGRESVHASFEEYVTVQAFVE